MQPIKTNGMMVALRIVTNCCPIVLDSKQGLQCLISWRKNLLLSPNVLLALLTFQTAVVIHLPLECV